ncbi:hypothetical protein [Streptomyces aidingensis]|uniref:Uncharacterized protein n=1 Tax=Streptomyces aidingensis TaxID=910347 RepID=A0A1I1KEY4_9ACTN|nr:hypothetical protein [Streptomyces aidingensis]SFC59369.1 hypothetical protein SAMN05421773_104208 [Streptomyces aidingensis]
MPKSLTVGQLIHQLDVFDHDLPVRLAINPDWPFAHLVGRVVEDQGDDGPAVFIAEDGQEGYLPPSVRTELDWS